MKKSLSGFTFVELIVVLIIITILSTIGFVTYESYLWMWRDTAKISLIKDIHSSFGVYSLKSRIPLPENRVDITASGTLFAYQWDFTQEVANTIAFKWNPYDDNLGIYPSYMLLENQKDSQILHYLEDRQSIQWAFVLNSYAFTDYQQLVPKVMWKALWIMMDSETQEPLHLIDTVSVSWSYDVVTGTWELRAYYSQSEYYESDMDRIIPDKDCMRILELGWSIWSGVYTINPSGVNKVRVYCDMLTDGWWWNLIVNNDNSDDESASSTDCKPRFSWFPAHACGSVSESNDFSANIAGIEFQELVFSWYSWKFTNMNTYQYMKWDTPQIIPDTDTYELDIATSWNNELATKKWINDLKCSSWNPKYVTLQNGLGVFEPHTAIQTDLSWSEYEFSFIDDGPASASKNTYGLDDYQDGDGCSDNWGNKVYRGSSAYIMVR